MRSALDRLKALDTLRALYSAEGSPYQLRALDVS
jgi:hypothetical protein